MQLRYIFPCFVDFRKACDPVWHDGLFCKLEDHNILGSFLEILKKYVWQILLCNQNKKPANGFLPV